MKRRITDIINLLSFFFFFFGGLNSVGHREKKGGPRKRIARQRLSFAFFFAFFKNLTSFLFTHVWTTYGMYGKDRGEKKRIKES